MERTKEPMHNLDSMKLTTDPLAATPPFGLPDQVAPAVVIHSAPVSGQCLDAITEQAVAPGLAPLPVTLIHARATGTVASFFELFQHLDLLRFLVRREIKVRYAQSAIGVGWAVLQPLFPMLIFTVVFGQLAKISSDGIPYAVFSFVGLVPWLYFSNGVTDGVNSLISNANMLSKVYFPRLLIPLAAIISRSIDACVASVVLAGMLLWYGLSPQWSVIVIPWLLCVTLLTTVGVACWLSTLALQYRDVKHALSFLIQVLMYTAPVVYPTSLIPPGWRGIYALNPMVGVIESLRSCLLGTGPMPWMLLMVGSISSLGIGLSGASYFIHKQRQFADVA
jgi:lipopolysaccharide transport system permease protein